MNMNKKTIYVPSGIRYISDWKEYSIPKGHCIVDKQIPGCGFTEYCLTGNFDCILVSPRKILLKNKEDQHPGEVLYVKSSLSFDPGMDKDISNLDNTKKFIPKVIHHSVKEIRDDLNKMKDQIANYIALRSLDKKPIKLIVTYDSFRKLKAVLTKYKELQNFQVVVDEFQSIFTDSRFKSSTELEFVDQLQGVSDVCYVSATPMMDEYLDQLEEFKGLPYYVLDWYEKDHGRVIKPKITVRSLRTINESLSAVIDNYRNGKGEKRISLITGKEVQSREAVIYVNSVKNICSIIRHFKLMPDEVNILCADTPQNKMKIGQFTRVRKNLFYDIGHIPTRNEPRKMFTLCTRTVYLGADFYSDNARSYVVSDVNIDSLAVDITLDLPQILGRQRLAENPWRDEVVMYVKYNAYNDPDAEEKFKEYLKTKLEKTESLLRTHKNIEQIKDRNNLSEVFKRDIIAYNYKYNFVAINEHRLRYPVSVTNNLAYMAEKRAFDIQKIDYKDRFTMFNAIQSRFGDSMVDNVFLDHFNEIRETRDKLIYLCEYQFKDESSRNQTIRMISPAYYNYYTVVGPDGCRACSYNISKIKREYENRLNKDKISIGLVEELNQAFKVDGEYTKAWIKETLQGIYNKIGYNRNAKASDLGDWYETKAGKFKNASGKWEHGFKILKKL